MRTSPRGRQIIIATISTPNSSTRYSAKLQQLRRHRQHEGRQHHAEGGAHAAQHHDRQDQRRFEEGERGRVDEALIGGEKYPASPAVEAPSINADSFTST